MTAQENQRLFGWQSALPTPPADVSKLSQVLNAKAPDMQRLITLGKECGMEPQLGLLLQLFIEGKRVGVIELMSERGKTKRRRSSRRNVEMGVRWLRLEYDDPIRCSSKKAVAETLADEFHLDFDYVYRELMRGSRDSNTTLFPDGSDAARRAAGL